jgi:hypothetical protein
MTESEYQATISAERTFGRIQVHQKFRALARELGLPNDCSLPTEVSRRLPRWYVDPKATIEAAYWRDRSAVRVSEYVAVGILRPGPFAKGGLVTGNGILAMNCA